MKIPEKPPLIPNRSKISIFNIGCRDTKFGAAINEINEQYLSWSEVYYKYISVFNLKKLEEIWLIVRELRRSASQTLNIFKSQSLVFTFSPYIPGSIQESLHEFDMTTGEVLDSFIPSKDRDIYLLSSLMEEAIASSQLEGAATSRNVAKDMLRTKRKPKNKNEQMILNNYVTMSLIVNDLKGKMLTPEILKQVQISITRDTLENKEYSGSFRKNNNVHVQDDVGQTLHVPPDYGKLTELVQELCDFANSSEPYIHPVVKASILHFLIGYIHPFEDGNGRTARAIFYWYLLSKGYWLFEFLAISRIINESKAQYARAYLYCEQDENDMTYFIKFQIDKIKLALRDLKEYIKRKTNERQNIFDFMQVPGVNERQASILSLFSSDPRRSIVISEVQDLFKVVYQTARNDLLELEKNGFLRKKVVGKKMIFFRSDNFNNLVPKSKL